MSIRMIDELFKDVPTNHPLLDESKADPELATVVQAMSQRVSKQLCDLRQWCTSLDQNNQQLAIVLESMVEGVIAIDSQETILLANAAAIRLLDIKLQNVTGLPYWEVIRIPSFQELVQQTLNGGDQRRREFSVTRPQLILSAVSSRLPGEPSEGVVIVLHDVTELRRLENMRRDFVSNVSHELKTPLSSISAYAETLLDGAIDDAETNRVFVGRIAEQSDRLHALIVELLSLAKLESDEHTLELTAVDVGAVICSSLKDHEDVAKSRSLRLTSEPPAESIWGMADVETVRTIVDNLLDNAINYTPAGGSVTVRWRADGNWVEFEVADTGIGIAMENQTRIFERFFRVDKARSRAVGGTGLGLSIVKHLCQVIGGQIKLSSQLGEGSLFTVRIPAATSVP
ncbi:MAG: PAS domain-containing protein, partial [Planctomycetes bacterium]|nr:PAS domain-containing protein [Planctomycetota bacterium]